MEGPVGMHGSQMEPPPKRVRRGRVKRSSLSWDAWQLVVRTLDPMRVILMLMTCKSMRANIGDDHELWKRLFIMWEWRNGGSRRVPDSLGCNLLAPALPPMGWQAHKVMDVPEFNRMVALTYVKCCGLCGEKRKRTDPVWALNVRVCENCLRGNLISNAVLHSKYGVGLVRSVDLNDDDKTPFIEMCFGKVLFFMHKGTDSERKRYTVQPCDFDLAYRGNIMFFWEPHVRSIVDLDGLCKLKKQRQQAGRLVHALVRRLRVQRVIHGTFKKGVTEGFGQMKARAKKAVLNNLQTKGINTSRREYYQQMRSCERVYSERLFADGSTLMAAAKQHMGTISQDERV